MVVGPHLSPSLAGPHSPGRATAAQLSRTSVNFSGLAREEG